jgi:triosephosphate isomerase
MNPLTIEDAKKLSSGVKKIMKRIKKTNVVLCPPYVYLPLLQNIPTSNLFLGAQNANPEMLGSLTGEVSYAQISQFKAEYVIIGHSERRKMGEDDEMVNRKVRSVLSAHMNAIICVGEATRDHNGEYMLFIKDQIIKALKDVSKKNIPQVVIAYEPIWAIGAREAMSTIDLHEMSIYIKKVLRELYGILADSVLILYGGSVDKNNAGELVREGMVSGLLVGRQSLNAKDFAEIDSIK